MPAWYEHDAYTFACMHVLMMPEGVAPLPTKLGKHSHAHEHNSTKS